MSQNQKIKSFKIEGVEIPLTILKNEVIDSLLAGNNLICNYSVEYEPEKPKSNVLFALDPLETHKRYWFIDSQGIVKSEQWEDADIDLNRLYLNNVFLAKENAQKQADRNKLLADIERFAVQNNGEIDWSEVNKTKYFISYDNLDNKWVGDSNSKYKIQGTTYFSSATIAAQALEKFKDRLDILLD